MPFYCYLLRSLSSPTSRAAYIGFTTDPHQRLRQHNGEIKAGAYHTSKRRPWIHVLVVEGFPNKFVALQFEWHWQHPERSRLYRTGLNMTSEQPSFKTTHGFKAKLKVLQSLLSLPIWQSFQLKVHVVDATLQPFIRSLLDPLPCVQVINSNPQDIAYLSSKPSHPSSSSSLSLLSTSQPALMCILCQETHQDRRIWLCPHCKSTHHVYCLGKHNVDTMSSNPLRMVPIFAECGDCQSLSQWMQVVQQSFLPSSNMNYLQEEQDEVDEQDAEEVDDGDGDEDEEEHDKHQEIDLVDVERQKQTHIGDGLMLEGLIAEDVPQSVDGGYGSIVDGFMFYS